MADISNSNFMPCTSLRNCRYVNDVNPKYENGFLIFEIKFILVETVNEVFAAALEAPQSPL